MTPEIMNRLYAGEETLDDCLEAAREIERLNDALDTATVQTALYAAKIARLEAALEVLADTHNYKLSLADGTWTWIRDTNGPAIFARDALGPAGNPPREPGDKS